MAKMLMVNSRMDCNRRQSPHIWIEGSPCCKCFEDGNWSDPPPDYCPLPDAEPAPYSEENPPQENDLVLVELEDGKQVGFVECSSNGRANVRFAYSHPCEPLTEGFRFKDLTLLFRPRKEGE